MTAPTTAMALASSATTLAPPADTPAVTVLTFRDTIKRRSPPWLQRGLAEKILYSIGLQCDTFADALVAGVKQRFPGRYSYESLAPLGRERRIPRGRNEDDASYAGRLTGFLSMHALRGGPYALLAQLYYYWRPDWFRIELLYRNGRRFVLNDATLIAGGSLEDAIERDWIEWYPDSDAAKWARWWLFYYTDQWVTVPPTESELAELRFVPSQWNAAHCMGIIVVFASTTELWNLPLGHTWNEPGTWNTTGAPPIYVEVK